MLSEWFHAAGAPGYEGNVTPPMMRHTVAPEGAAYPERIGNIGLENGQVDRQDIFGKSVCWGYPVNSDIRDQPDTKFDGIGGGCAVESAYRISRPIKRVLNRVDVRETTCIRKAYLGLHEAISQRVAFTDVFDALRIGFMSPWRVRLRRRRQSCSDKTLCTPDEGANIPWNSLRWDTAKSGPKYSLSDMKSGIIFKRTSIHREIDVTMERLDAEHAYAFSIRYSLPPLTAQSFAMSCGPSLRSRIWTWPKKEGLNGDCVASWAAA